MNQTTEDVIVFLTNPDLDFGDNPMDVELLKNPELLHQKMRVLLDGPLPFTDGGVAGADLLSRLDECDWPAVAAEFSTRLKMTAHFFDQDAVSPARQSPESG